MQRVQRTRIAKIKTLIAKIKGKPEKPCFRRGDDHIPQTFRFKEADCHFCKHKGHIEKRCLKKGAANDKYSDKEGKPLRYVKEDDSADGLFKNWQRSPEPSIAIPVAITTTTTTTK